MPALGRRVKRKPHLKLTFTALARVDFMQAIYLYDKWKAKGKYNGRNYRNQLDRSHV